MKRETGRTVTNPIVSAILTDKYQLTTAYASYLQGRHEVPAVYNMFFRRNPFGGEYTIFAGLEEVLSYLESFRFSDDDIEYLREEGLPGCQTGFYEWLAGLTCKGMTCFAPPEGTIVFPQEPLITVKTGAALGRLIETVVLNLTGFASLCATEASRMRAFAGPNAVLAEFGLRRAQGPDGGLTASRSAYIGGFDSTSNILAGKRYGIPVSGTMSHAFIQEHSGMDFDDLYTRWLTNVFGQDVDFAGMVLQEWGAMGSPKTNRSELVAFVAFAIAFPKNFLALVDTYSTMESGVPNYIAVATALWRCGYSPRGIRLDSGDLVNLSNDAREMFRGFASLTVLPELGDTPIMASNDIGEDELREFARGGHSMTGFGIGTKIATCDAQPALGMVYKLVEIDGHPVAKRSEEKGKSTFPGQKQVWRLSGFKNDEMALVDVIALWDEKVPKPGDVIMYYDPKNGQRGDIFVSPKIEMLVKEISFGSERESLKGIRERARNGFPLSPNNKVLMSQALWEMTQKAQGQS